MTDQAQCGDVRTRLLAWYDSAKRDLPWRKTTDPYAIWVSEIMLQQTRVDTVIPYYERFLARFPRLEDLAAATEDEVLSHWTGLGYYRRARMLHAGVREVVERYGAAVPRDAELRTSLPGIGRYTAGAIGSIAFGFAEPTVDGNVARVLTRFLGIDTALGRPETEKRLWSEASAWVRGERPGDLNQAVMELGATVCTKGKASCERCPLRADCYAHAHGRVQDLPVPRAKAKPRDVDWVAVVATYTKRDQEPREVWLERGESALFGGLWGVPMAEGRGKSAAHALLEARGLNGELEGEPLGVITHVLSHRRLSVEVWRAFHASGRPTAALIPRTTNEFERLGASRLTHKIFALAFGSLSSGAQKATNDVGQAGRQDELPERFDREQNA